MSDTNIFSACSNNEIENSSINTSVKPKDAAPNSSPSESCSSDLSETDIRIRAEEYIQLLEDFGDEKLTDNEMIVILKAKLRKSKDLETICKDSSRGVQIRRKWQCENYGKNEAFDKIPFQNYNYDKVSSIIGIVYSWKNN